jgi:hypothetical protein
LIENEKQNTTRINSTNEKLNSFENLVTVNLINLKPDKNNSKSNNNSNISNKTQNTINSNEIIINNNVNASYSAVTGQNKLEDTAFFSKLSKKDASDSSIHIWQDESNSGWTSTGVMSERSSVYSIDDGVLILFLFLFFN